jgi:hypothetical protein
MLLWTMLDMYTVLKIINVNFICIYLISNLLILLKITINFVWNSIMNMIIDKYGTMKILIWPKLILLDVNSFNSYSHNCKKLISHHLNQTLTLGLECLQVLYVMDSSVIVIISFDYFISLSSFIVIISFDSSVINTKSFCMAKSILRKITFIDL